VQILFRRIAWHSVEEIGPDTNYTATDDQHDQYPRIALVSGVIVSNNTYNTAYASHEDADTCK
jgi:hypothetical protein